MGDYRFVSVPLATSSRTFVEIGHEQNGSFLATGVTRASNSAAGEQNIVFLPASGR